MNQANVSENIASLIPKDKFIVAYTGAVGIANSLITFAEAANKMKKNKEILFVIVGNGSEKEKIEVYKTEKSLTNLLLLDPIPKECIIPFLKNYVDVCYIGLQKQSLFRFGISPNKIFDYLFSQTPIIQSVDASNDIVSESKSGLSVEAENASQVVEAIEKLFNMTESERKIMGQNGLEYVTQNHSYQKLAHNYESLFV